MSTTMNPTRFCMIFSGIGYERKTFVSSTPGTKIREFGKPRNLSDASFNKEFVNALRSRNNVFEFPHWAFVKLIYGRIPKAPLIDYVSGSSHEDLDRMVNGFNRSEASVSLIALQASKEEIAVYYSVGCEDLDLQDQILDRFYWFQGFHVQIQVTPFTFD